GFRDARLQRSGAGALHRPRRRRRRAEPPQPAHVRGLVAMADAAARRTVSVRSVNCPNCGAATAVRTFGHAVNVVCQSRLSILDAKDPGVAIIQAYKTAMRYEPAIPLGSRGKLRVGAKDILYEVVGFQVRQIMVDDTAYQWREYLLFNPYQEFRYLTEYPPPH